jgi:hypothetical protein
VFNELLKVARQLDGAEVRIGNAAPNDDEGYVDRECPAPECLFTFKIHGDDWRDIVRDEEVFCPFCGHAAAARSWWTTEQIENVRRRALEQVRAQLGQAMKRDAANFNRRQSRGGFVTMSMGVKLGHHQVTLPLAATEPMRLKIGCETCSCRYSVIGSAYFCPSCGHNSADRVFNQSLGTIKSSLDALSIIRDSIKDPDVAENTVRLVIEAGLQNCVTAFQRYAEAMFAKRPSPEKIRRNAFQSLSEGAAIWQSAFGRDYSAHLNGQEMASLGVIFQQRHLLAHKDGLIDEDYVKKSGDLTYQAGQRVVVREDSVRRSIELIEKLGIGMAADLNGRPQLEAASP